MSDKAKILIAEDVEGNYFLLEVILGEQFELLHAKDGLEAVEMFKSEKPDLVLMDILMPNMDGMEATREIRKFDNETPIIAVTAYSYNQDNYLVDEAEENGFSGVILKPIRSDSLLSEIEKNLGK